MRRFRRPLIATPPCCGTAFAQTPPATPFDNADCAIGHPGRRGAPMARPGAMPHSIGGASRYVAGVRLSLIGDATPR